MKFGMRVAIGVFVTSLAGALFVIKDAGKMEMLPWIGVAAVGASLLTAATIKVVDYFKAKRAQDQQAIDTAKQEIIKGIKAYDEEQEQHDLIE